MPRLNVQRLMSLLLALLIASEPLTALAVDDTPKDTAPYKIETGSGIPVETKLEGLVSVVQKADLSKPNFLGADPSLIANQFRYKYSDDGKAVVEKIPLTRIDVTNTPVGINPKQLNVVYDAQVRELRIERTEIRKGEDKQPHAIRTDAHVIPDIDVTSNIVDTPLFVAFATPEGMRISLKSLLYPSLFLAGVPADVIVPVPSVEGAKITKIELLTKANGAETMINDDDWTKYGDFAVTVTLPNGESVRQKIDMSEIVLSVRQRLILTYVAAMVANGDPNVILSEEFQKILKENADELQAYSQAIEKSSAQIQQDLKDSLVNIGQREPLKVMQALFEADADTGKDSFHRLAEADRHTFSQEEARHYQEPPKEPEKEVDTRSFRERYLNRDFARSTYNKAISRSTYQSAYKKMITYLTPQRLRMTAAVLVGIPAIYGLDWATGGALKHFTVNMMATMIEHANHYPGVKLLTEEMVDKKTGKALQFLTENWAVTRVAIGAGIVMTFYPISFWLGKAVSKLRGETLPKIKAFFTEGVRLYGLVNYPLQKLCWEYLWNQKNRYLALEVNHESKYAWNSIRASKETIQENAKKMNDEIDATALQKTKATLIAARLVSQRYDVDLAGLLMAGYGKKLSTFVDMMTNPQEAERFKRLSTQARMSLASIAKDGDAVLTDGAQIKAFEDRFDVIAQEMKNVKDGKLAATLKAMKEEGKATGRWLWQTIAYGNQGLKLYRQFKDVNLDDHTVEIALESYKDDYFSSTGIYALTDTERFADLGRWPLGPHASEVAFNQAEQNFIYGMQGPVDPLSAAVSSKLVLPEKYEPPANELYGKNGPNARAMNFSEGMSGIVKENLNPNSMGHFKNHQNYLKNLIDGFQVRVAVGSVLRFVGLWGAVTAAAALTGAAHPLWPVIFISAMTIQSWFLYDKIAFHVSDGSFRPGYATVWPYVHLTMRQMLSVASGNLNALQKADYLLDTGIRFNNREMMVRGIKLTFDNFAKGNKTLPAIFKAFPEDFSPELANQLLEYTRENIPLPTKGNPMISKILNVGLGALASTALYTALSHTAYDPHNLSILTNLGILAKTLGFFSATYVGLGVAQTVTKTVVKTLKETADFCARKLGEFQGLRIQN